MAQEKTENHKKLYIKTWGCQMNVYDSNRMADILSGLGYKPVEAPDDADMIILNTCHIREKATDKVFSELGRLRKHKDAKEEQGKKMLMAVAGCVAQAEGDFIMERAPYVDMVFGPQTYHELPEMVLKAAGEDRIINTEFPSISKFDHLPEQHTIEGASAFLSIQEGCDKFCTFCVVPYTRGAEYSRSATEIVEEAKRLVDQGALEITLLGQNVNAFHGTGPDGKTWSLADLIYAVSEIEGLERIRYTTSHPRDMGDDLIAVHGEVMKLMPFLHLPVQSGSDKILKAMNRKHKAELYRDVVARLRKARPDLAFSSDYIIGFPGETEEDFEDTMQLARDIGYASCYSFKYSARPGTPAANMQNLVLDHIASERLSRFQALINEQQLAFNKQCEGLELDILFEKKGKKDGQISGRSPYFQSVHVQGNERLIGTIQKVRISEGFENSLTGELVLEDGKVLNRA
ncbi:MAG: tRNA (N6-isopentenyl adenosine(37)-C2)-methylthiotransferase MiaB [Alphaproteobacteria bacterium]|nr:tRNA (N6-isopentenyl adenosine(37)-C2)-methylthiotransferase MiaB [Alphaproteobacteria bacterium]